MHGPSSVVMKEEIECERMLWKVGDMNHHERGGLGDSQVQGKVNQREDRETMN